MKGYIDLNTSRRAAAKTESENTFTSILTIASLARPQKSLESQSMLIVNNVERRNKLVASDDFASIKKFMKI